MLKLSDFALWDFLNALQLTGHLRPYLSEARRKTKEAGPFRTKPQGNRANGAEVICISWPATQAHLVADVRLTIEKGTIIFYRKEEPLLFSSMQGLFMLLALRI